MSVLSLAAARAGWSVVAATSTAATAVVDGALQPIADLSTGRVTARQSCCSVSLLGLCWHLGK